LSHLCNDQLNDMLDVARRKNQDPNLSGLLIHADGAIMQLIEGPPDAEDLDQCVHLVLDQASLHTGVRNKGIVGKLLPSFMREA
jgi:hypothetical protein